MMDWTDRHYRYFARLMSKNSVLYTEMVTTGAIIHGDQDRHLQYSDEEHPIALQLGGSNPEELAKCCKIADQYSYDEINLNVGCPSDRVQNNMIGACLMSHPQLVKDCLISMQGATSTPVTIKHRIGVDDFDSYQHLADFVSQVADSGCKTFIIHARKAILSGLSPKQNREIPPLIYDYVYRLKAEQPDLEIIINGGIKDYDEIDAHLKKVDGVMLGREAYQHPWILSEVDSRYYPSKSGLSVIKREEVVNKLLPYIESELIKGQKLSYITRHILGLFHGQKGGKQFRRYLSENAHKPNSGPEVLESALSMVTDR